MSDGVKPGDGDPARAFRHKIFLSADIVGSTAFKQHFDARNTEALIESEKRVFAWQRAIGDFYSVVQRTLRNEWEILRDAVVDDEIKVLLFGEAPRVWKTVGDEILFWKQIDHELQIVPLLAAWFAAIDGIRAKFKEDSDGHGTRGLDIKATVWSAEFPYRNRVTATGDEDGTDAWASAAKLMVIEEEPKSIIANYYAPSGDGPSGKVDFIGPGIDVGFRVATRSTSRKMAISLDVAYLLSCVGVWYEKSSDPTGPKLLFPDTTQTVTKHTIFCNTLIERERSKISDYLKNNLKAPIDFASSKTNDFLHSCRVHFSGRSELKGAFGNVRYPFFWISTASKTALDAYTEALYLDGRNRTPLDWKKLYSYCRKFYGESERYLHPPLVSMDPQWPFCGDAEQVGRYKALIERIDNKRAATVTDSDA